MALKRIIQRSPPAGGRLGKRGLLAAGLPVLALVCTLALWTDKRLPSGPVVINEILLRNRFVNFDEDGNTSPWVELYNAGKAVADLADLYLSNEPRLPRKWHLPSARLSPGEYLLVWCSAKDRAAAAKDQTESLFSVSHANFKLEKRSEIILLAAGNGEVLDAVLVPPQTEDRSYGRSPNGTGDFLYQLCPTPGRENQGPVSRQAIPSRPGIDPPGGKYPGPLELKLSMTIPLDDFQVRYTLDGSAPRASSRPYRAPIPLVAGGWNRTQVVRAAAFLGAEQVSQIETQSYFVDSASYQLPVLSMSMDTSDFQAVHLNVAGRGRGAERPGYLELFLPDGVRAFGSGMGLRLHGLAGRYGDLAKKKSYRLYFRDVYGNGKLRYPLIPGEKLDLFDQVVLRANNDDALSRRTGGAYVRDQLLREIHLDMGELASHGSWYNLFINMDYRGVYNVVERINSDFLSHHHSPPGQQWDVIHDGEVLEGDLTEWTKLVEFFRDSDLHDDSAYDKAVTLIDLSNYTNYMILNIWAQNHDWPHKNYFAARPRRPGGKWIFLIWDAELGLGLYPEGFQANTFERVFTRESILGEIFLRLMRNPRYQSFFLERVEAHLQEALSPGKVLRRIGRLRETLAPDLKQELRDSPADLFGRWLVNLGQLERFAVERGKVIRELILSSGRVFVPRVTGVSPERVVLGKATEVTLTGRDLSESMTVFFNNVPVRILASAPPRSVTVVLPPDERIEGSPRITVSDPRKGNHTARGLLRVSRRDPAGR